MAPFKLTGGLPRRSRVFLIVLVFVLVMFFLPSSDSGVGRTLLLVLFGSPPSNPVSRASTSGDILKYIDPLIGTINGGHVFPGATLPYGMAKPVADIRAPAENAAGYVSDDNPVSGFSHMHDSGTGGQPSLGNFPIFVNPGCPNGEFAQCQYSVIGRAVNRIQGSAKASPGYFAISLNHSVHAEMTATEHTALYRFSFPGVNNPINYAGERVPYSPVISMDLSDLMTGRAAGTVGVDPETGQITGGGRYNPSFGVGTYEAFFCANFIGAKIKKTGTFMGDAATEEVQFLDSAQPGSWTNPSGSAGAWIQFEAPANDKLLARVGVSFKSKEKACQNAKLEIPDFAFSDTVKAAEDAWRDKLSVIEVDPTGVDEEFLTTFWSGIYRAMLSPQNYTDENPYWNSSEPYFDSFYCIWDSFRAQHPLLTILDPVAQTEMVRALIDIYRFEGKLPDCRMSFCKGFTQGGSNADVVLADALLKNITDGIDWDTAYEAVVSDAEVEAKNWGVEGRGNLDSYHSLGYIPWDDVDKKGAGPMSRTISRTVEYAYDDFCISTMAKALGHQSDAQKYLERSTNWQNLWNPEQQDLYRDTKKEVIWSDYMGFLQPKKLDGSWRYHNTRLCSPIHEMHSCYYDTAYDTYEGSPWLYSFFVPQDMSSLVAAMGGKEQFVKRLSYFHTSGIAYMGNEQTFLTIFQFHYGGRPGLSSYFTHYYIPSQFNASVNGIPGNDDCAMGAFTAFAFMGFFPVAGQDVYLLIPPFFSQVKIRARNGQWAIIKVKNFDPQRKAIYIQSATLNGKKYTKNWITHDFFMNGGILEYVVSENEGIWGTHEVDLPPSWPVKPIQIST